MTKLTITETQLQEKAELSILADWQIKAINTATPAQYVKTDYRGNQYVSGGYIKNVLDSTFGHRWNFEVVKEQIVGDQVVVLGRLTVKMFNKQTGAVEEIVKMQYGGAKLKKHTKDGKQHKAGDFVDLGNDFKSAATSALKKCASEFGIASDVYRGDDFIEVEVVNPEKEKDEREKGEKTLYDAKTIEDLTKAYLELPRYLQVDLKPVATACKEKLQTIQIEVDEDLDVEGTEWSA